MALRTSPPALPLLDHNPRANHLYQAPPPPVHSMYVLQLHHLPFPVGPWLPALGHLVLLVAVSQIHREEQSLQLRGDEL